MSQITVSLLKDERDVAVWILPEADTDGIKRAESYWVMTPVKGKGSLCKGDFSLQCRSDQASTSSARSSGTQIAHRRSLHWLEMVAELSAPILQGAMGIQGHCRLLLNFQGNTVMSVRYPKNYYSSLVWL